MIYYLLIYILVGYLVIRFMHKYDRVPNVYIGLLAIIVWPLVLIILIAILIMLSDNTEKLVDKIFGE